MFYKQNSGKKAHTLDVDAGTAATAALQLGTILRLKQSPAQTSISTNIDQHKRGMARGVKSSSKPSLLVRWLQNCALLIPCGRADDSGGCILNPRCDPFKYHVFENSLANQLVEYTVCGCQPPRASVVFEVTNFAAESCQAGTICGVGSTCTSYARTHQRGPSPSSLLCPMGWGWPFRNGFPTMYSSTF